MKAKAFRNGAAGTVLAVLVALILAVPVWAYQEEGGYKNCGAFIGFVHARFMIDGLTFGPGDSIGIYWDYGDANWHVQEDNGTYSGSWLARGIDYLDMASTYAGCRNYGK